MSFVQLLYLDVTPADMMEQFVIVATVLSKKKEIDNVGVKMESMQMILKIHV